MPSPYDQIAWLAINRERVVRYMFIPQLLVALLFLSFSYSTGHAHARILLQGAQAQGRIVAVRSVRMSTRSNTRLSDSDTVDLPTIEFMANGRLIRFEEWKGTRSDPGVGAFVPVLYDPADTSVAMMDRGLWNWLPWAPCFAIGFLLLLASLKGVFSLLRAPQPVTRSPIRA